VSGLANKPKAKTFMIVLLVQSLYDDPIAASFSRHLSASRILPRKGRESSYLFRGLPRLRGIFTNHFSSDGVRITSASNATISSGVSLTPVAYVVSTTLTTGCFPFQVIDRARPNTASTESSSVCVR
jgi:hypothetical protein